MSANKPETGDWYEWHKVIIEVGEIAPDGRWAMIHCSVNRDPIIARKDGPQWYVHMWSKQQPTPEGEFPRDWIKVKEPPDWVRPYKPGPASPGDVLGRYRAYPDGSDRRHP
jgi:hypothetical protein